jgi:hypothetical protein
MPPCGATVITILPRFAEVPHLCSSEEPWARNGTASSHASGVAAWFRRSVEREARGGKSIDNAVSSRAAAVAAAWEDAVKFKVGGAARFLL